MRSTCFGGRVRWEILERVVHGGVGLVAGTQYTTDRAAFEVEHELLRLRLPVHAGQADDLDDQADLLASLADRRIPRRLASLDASTRQVPGVHVAAVAQQHASLLVEDDRECSCLQHLR